MSQRLINAFDHEHAPADMCSRSACEHVRRSTEVCGSRRTPGPWAVWDGRVYAGRVSIAAPEGDHTVPIDECVPCANALLIAAAPELLEALRDLLASVDDYCGDADQGWHQEEPRNAARAAIKKAGGISPAHPL